MNTITITFEVDDDLPSERRLQYRQAVIDAMIAYQAGVKNTAALIGQELVSPEAFLNAELIDKMLEDCNR
jgi:hypothetical protein